MHWYHSVLVEDKVERSFWNEHRNNRGAKTGTQKNNQTNKKTWPTREPNSTRELNRKKNKPTTIRIHRFLPSFRNN
jgi:hypothetical protein